MVTNLNKTTFSEYGTIRPERPAEDRIPRGVQWELHTMQVEPHCKQAFFSKTPVFLDYVSGMTVLALSLDGKNYKPFYLDKPVELRAGVFFALVSYAGPSQVRMATPAGALPQTRQLHGDLAGLQLSRRTNVQSIFTLFHQKKEPGFFFPGESHPTWELTYLEKGAIHSVADGQDLLLEAGEMTLYAPGQWHMQYAGNEDSASYVTVSFQLEYGDLTALQNRKFKAPHQAVSLVQQMLQEQARGDSFSEDMLVSLLGTLLVVLQRECRELPRNTPVRSAAAVRNEKEIVSRAQQYVSAHVQERMSVPAVAKAAGVSSSHLTALFHKNLQISPGEYIRRIKLEESRQLIREGKMNFTEISRVLQYSTVHHFSRQFKEKFGMTPTEYARSVRK